MYEGCGTKKYCVESSPGCIENKDCVAVVAVRRRGYQFEFEMIAKNSAYVAFGISEDNKMVYSTKNCKEYVLNLVLTNY